MTEPEAPQSVPENEPEHASTDDTPAPEAEAEPPPEPWTPERVNEWNAYYDIYVMAAAVLLAMIVACNAPISLLPTASILGCSHGSA